ncbi:MAG TPA: GntR family transcriptional regulator [Syntrophorhabdaceae bacterium]|nr:GntR family transcriptional regulator [Syntrophorhabdaceae bacterium]
MKKFTVEDNGTLRKKVLDHLREKILNGEIEADERLIETTLAREIGISRTPVREALHNLERERLIKAIPRVGYVVARMKEREMEEICKIRMAIEGLALRWAIERSQKKLAEELKKNVLKQEKEILKENLRAYAELDGQFHEASARLSGSDRLLEMAPMLRWHMLRFRRQSIYMINNAVRSMKGHKRILQAIERSDPEAAVAALERHLQEAQEDLLSYDPDKAVHLCA